MTTSASLTDQLAAQLQGPQLQQLASRLGIAPEQAQSAVQTALPLLMGALGRNSQQAGGTDALLGALQRDHAGSPDLGSLLGTLLGGSASGAQGNGAGIVGHLFGDRRRRLPLVWARPPAWKPARPINCCSCWHPS